MSTKHTITCSEILRIVIIIVKNRDFDRILIDMFWFTMAKSSSLKHFTHQQLEVLQYCHIAEFALTAGWNAVRDSQNCFNVRILLLLQEGYFETPT